MLPEIVPLPAELREEGGVLWWAGGRPCEAKVLDVSSGVVTPVPGEACGIWPAEHGGRAVALSETPQGPRLVLYAHPAPEGERVLGEGTILPHAPAVELGPGLRLGPAWDPAGERLAVCVAGRDGLAVQVLDLRGERNETVEGACSPGFLADGRLAVVRGFAEVVLGGRVIAGEAEAVRLLPGAGGAAERFFTALGARGDRLVAGLVAVGPEGAPSSAAVAVLTPRGSVEFSAHLRPDTVPVAVGLAPADSALWYWYAEDEGGVAVILEVPGGRRRQPFRARWVAWSPSGRYLAAATDRGLEVYSWPDGREVAVVEAEAATVAWSARPEGGG